MNYKRLTKHCEVGIGLNKHSIDITEAYIDVITRLCELEDKIENGTLIEVESPYTEEELSRKLVDIEIQNMKRSLSVPGSYYSPQKPTH